MLSLYLIGSAAYLIRYFSTNYGRDLLESVYFLYMEEGEEENCLSPECLCFIAVTFFWPMLLIEEVLDLD